MSATRTGDHSAETKKSDWPGRSLGLPSTGSRSIARFGRRLTAFAIDSALGALLSAAFFNYDRYASLAIFVVLQIIFLTLLSGSIGHLLLGMRVVPLKFEWIGWWRPAARTALLALLVPALFVDRNRRGLHDRLAGTVLVMR